MCGLAGIVRPLGARPIAAEEPARMARLMAHRGPDAEDHWREGTAALAHRRLAVIDIAGGAQPLADAEGRHVLVYNGEIYNFRELRAELDGLGHRFRTSCDTEVVLEGYRAWGTQLPGRLHGMFAFAVWDRIERTLFAARDRLGQKPFYYTTPAEGGVAFASEMKALFALSDASPDIDPAALAAYFIYQYTPGPTTLARGVRRLPPSHWLRWRDGDASPEVRRYWHLAYHPKSTLDREEALAATEEHLERAVADRLVADVPLGCFLSGGLDSSAVALAMARQAGGRIRTFNIRFAEEAFDESPHARRVAEIAGAEHHELTVTPRAAEVFGELAWHLDDLMGDPSAIPQFYLARFTRQHVTVALSGDGGDESFAGYERYRHLRSLPAAARPLARLGLAGANLLGLGALARRRGAGAMAHRLYFARTYARGGEPAYTLLMTLFWPELLRSILAPDLVAQLDPGAFDNTATLAAMDHGGARAPLDRLMASDIHTYLPGDLLVKVDRMTMAHGLEARSPFLDHRLMEFAARLPPATKMPGGRLKDLIKRSLARHLPADLIDRPKAGFGVPIGAWFRGPLAGWLRALLLDEPARSRGYLDPRGVEALLRAHARSGRHGHRLWMLALFELWCRTYLDGRRDGPIDPGIG